MKVVDDLLTVNNLARLIDPSDLETTQDVVRLLSALCFIKPNG